MPEATVQATLTNGAIGSWPHSPPSRQYATSKPNKQQAHSFSQFWNMQDALLSQGWSMRKSQELC